MQDLLAFIIKNITGSDNFAVTESEEDGGKVTLHVEADPEIVGLIIGKEGKTVKSIRRIVSVRAALEQKAVHISVNSKE